MKLLILAFGLLVLSSCESMSRVDWSKANFGQNDQPQQQSTTQTCEIEDQGYGYYRKTCH